MTEQKKRPGIVRVNTEVKYVVESISLTSSATRQYRSFRYILDKQYDYCTGIAIIPVTGGNPLLRSYINLSDDAGTIYDNVPDIFYQLKQYKLNNRLNFCDLMIVAEGNTLNLNWEFNMAVGTNDYQVVMRLERGERIKHKATKWEALNYQLKEYTIPTGTTANTILNMLDFDFNSAWRYVDGMYCYSINSMKWAFSLKSKEYQFFELFPAQLMPLEDDLELHNKVFFPLKTPAASNTNAVKLMPLINVPVDWTINFVFRLRNYK